jgi:hypothetical protein
MLQLAYGSFTGATYQITVVDGFITSNACFAEIEGFIVQLKSHS